MSSNMNIAENRDIIDRIMDIPEAIAEKIYDTTYNICSAALQVPGILAGRAVNKVSDTASSVGSAAKKVPGAIVGAGVGLTVSVATNAFNKTFNLTTATVSYATGYSNLNNAYTLLTRTEDMKIVLGDTNLKDKNGATRHDLKKFQIKKYVPSTWENVKAATNAEAFPIAIKGAFIHGGICTLGSAAGLIDPIKDTDKISSATSAFFNTTTEIVAPYVKIAASTMYGNALLSVAGLTSLGFLHSAKKDWDSTKKHNFGVNKDSAAGYVDTAKAVGSAFIKAAFGVAITYSAYTYNNK